MTALHSCFVPLLALLLRFTTAIELNTTEVFIWPIRPSLFKWTETNATNDFMFRSSLSSAPDLPSWVHYTYSERHGLGFLYGVPPNEPGDVELEVIGINRQNYETGRILLDMDIREREDPAKYEVQLKINNLNLEDLFDDYNQTKLLNVFHLLWPKSKDDLYMTFLASAINLGARFPMKSTEGDGVILRLGSRAKFSEELEIIQGEVKPLWSLEPCPREFKRTTVDLLFREQKFVIDWCSFRLLPEEVLQPTEHVEPTYQPVQIEDSIWYTLTRDEIPQRSYMNEVSLTILLPMLVMVILIFILSLILCFHHERMKDGSSEYFDSLFDEIDHYLRSRQGLESAPMHVVQYSSMHRASDVLHCKREVTPRPMSMAPLPLSTPTICVEGHLSTSTYPRCTSTPRRSEERTPFNRPEPPPYIGPQRK